MSEKSLKNKTASELLIFLQDLDTVVTEHTVIKLQTVNILKQRIKQLEEIKNVTQNYFAIVDRMKGIPHPKIEPCLTKLRELVSK